MKDENGHENRLAEDFGKMTSVARQTRSISEAIKSAIQSAKGISGSASASGATAGATTGTALAGPLGALIGAVVTSKTFWRTVVATIVSLLLFLYICVNIIPLTMEHLGFADANELVDQKNTQSIYAIKVRIQEIYEKVDSSEKELKEIVSKERDVIKKEIEADWKKNHKECTEIQILDEYELRMQPDFTTYLAYMLTNVWDSTTIYNFTSSSAEEYTTNLNSPYDDIFEDASEKYNISVALLKAVGKVESGYNPDSESSAGAMGVMQLMPALCKELGVTNPKDPRQNIMAGARYLASHVEAFKEYENGMQLAVAAYNAGGGAVRSAGYKIPDIEETQNYVKKVFSYLTPIVKKENGIDYEALYQQIKKVVEDNKKSLFDFGFDKEEQLERGERIAHYNLILGSVFESTVQGNYSYVLCTSPETFEMGIRILQASMDGVEAVWSAFDRMGDWMSKILQGIRGEGEDAGIDAKGDLISYRNLLSGCVTKVTYYNQGEEPWKDMAYGSGTIQSCGCGPTACAIVFSTLLGRDITPAMTCEYAMDHGEYTAGAGTNHSFPANAAAHWNVSCKRVKKSDFDTVIRALKNGGMAVVICEPYTITQSGSGHYIALVGVTKDGKIAIADPGSRERTSKVYTKEQIKGFARDLTDGSIWIMSREGD